MGKVININKFVDRPQSPRTLLRQDLSQVNGHSADVLPFQPSPTSSKYSSNGHKWLLSESSREHMRQFTIRQQQGIVELSPFV